MVIKTASPGVVVQEVDLTRGTPDAITNNNAFLAGPFKMGPVDEIVKITTEAELCTVFGKPQVEYNQDEYWFSVDNFLEYSGQCYVVRCDDSVGDGTGNGTGNFQTMKNAVDNFFYDPSLEGKINPNTGLKYTPNELFQSNAYIKNTTQFITATAGQSVINLGTVPQEVRIVDPGEWYKSAKGLKTSGPGGMVVDIIADETTGELLSVTIRETGKDYTNGLRVQVLQDPEDGLFPNDPTKNPDFGQIEVVVPNACFISKNPGAWGNGIGIAVIDHGADYQITYNSKSGHNIDKIVAAGKIITNKDDDKYTGDERRLRKDIIDPGQQIGEYVYVEVDPANSTEGSFQAVRLATTSDQGLSNVNIPLKGEQFVDGVLAVSGDRVLIWRQENQTQNGIYLVRGYDPSGRPIDWLRAEDADRSGNFVTGKRVMVKEGLTNKEKVFEYIGNNGPNLDESPEIAFFEPEVDLVSQDDTESLDLTDRMRPRDQWLDVDAVLDGTEVTFEDGSTLDITALIRNNDANKWRMQTCVVATSGDETYLDSYGNEVGGVNVTQGASAIGIVIDGYRVTEDDVVLIKDQADSEENGIWVASNTGWKRFGGAIAFQEYDKNRVVRIQAGIGSTNSDTFWTYIGETLTEADELWDNTRDDNTGAVAIEFERFVNGPTDSYGNPITNSAYGDVINAVADGVVLEDGMRVLITGLTTTWDEDTTAEDGRDNGIYVVSNNGPWVRAVDADQAVEFRKYKYVRVTGGSYAPDFYQFTDEDLTVMTSAKTFNQLSFEVGGEGIIGLDETLFDGETLNGQDSTDTNRVLLKNQANSYENGIYITSEGPWKRADDASRSAQFSDGKRVGVTDLIPGQGDDIYEVGIVSPFVLDTSRQEWTPLVIDPLLFDLDDDVVKRGDIITAPARDVEGVSRVATGLVMDVSEAAARVMLITDQPGLTPINFKTDDEILTRNETYVGRVTNVYAQGVHLYYNQLLADNLKINSIFIPAEYTRNQGISWNWNARPNDGDVVKSTTRAVDQVGVPIVDEDGNAVFVGGPAAVGEELVWNSREEKWVVNYRPKLSIDFISDGLNAYTISAADDWYSKQIAFEGIPWSNFAQRPGTSADAQNKGAFNDEVNILVYDATGEFTQSVGLPGGKGTIIDSYLLASKLRGAKTIEGSENFYQDLINNSNQFIFSNAQLHTLDINPSNIQLAPPGTPIGAGVRCQYITPRYGALDLNDINRKVDVPYLLKGGVDNLKCTFGEIQAGYNRVITDNLSDLDYIMQGPADTFSENSEQSDIGNSFAPAVAKANYIISIAEQLKTCVAVVSPPKSAAVDPIDAAEIGRRVIIWADQLASSSYAIIDSGYKYSYDRFNDRYDYFPLNSDVAGTMAQTSLLTQPFFSPAGMTRGQIKNVVKLGFNPNKSQRDDLFTSRVNPVCTFPGEGTVLYGDKTALSYSSAFSRINVRRLFIYIEKQVQRVARTVLFEFNDPLTRVNFKNNVNPLLRDIQSKRGLIDFLVVCDESNNTPEVIDRNEFVADFYIKPNRSINFVQLTFVATKSGASFGEQVGLFRRPNASF